MANQRVSWNRAWIKALKSSGRCADCKKPANRCGGAEKMMFIRHDTSTGEPIGTMVSRGRTRTSIERVLAEADLVCADCAVTRSRNRGRLAS